MMDRTYTLTVITSMARILTGCMFTLNKHIDDLRDDLNKHIEDLKDEMKEIKRETTETLILLYKVLETHRKEDK